MKFFRALIKLASAIRRDMKAFDIPFDTNVAKFRPRFPLSRVKIMRSGNVVYEGPVDCVIIPQDGEA